jgi:hypothetical protein
MQKHIKARKIKTLEIHTQSPNVSFPWLLMSTFGVMPVFGTSYNHEFSALGIGQMYLGETPTHPSPRIQTVDLKNSQKG